MKLAGSVSERATLEAADLSRQTVVVTSDHGNIEDLSTRSHTLNPIATLAFGPGRHYVASRVRCLTDIAPGTIALADIEKAKNFMSVALLSISSSCTVGSRVAFELLV